MSRIKRFLSREVISLNLFQITLVYLICEFYIHGVSILIHGSTLALDIWICAIIACFTVMVCMLKYDKWKTFVKRKLSPYISKMKLKMGIEETQTDEDMDNYLVRLGLDKAVQVETVSSVENRRSRYTRTYPPPPASSSGDRARYGPSREEAIAQMRRELAEELGIDRPSRGWTTEDNEEE